VSGVKTDSLTTADKNSRTLARQFDFHQMPRGFVAPLGRALFRRELEDFQVDEIIDFHPSGEGEHLLLHIRKRDQNTSWVAGLLAALAGINRNDVGYCGMKDRFAVTTQWYSLYLPGRELDLAELQHDDFEIITAHRHSKKLRRGLHQGNQFKIVLRDFNVDPEHLVQRLRLIKLRGVPNYFAEQRFGHEGGNLHRAQQLMESDQLKGNRHGTGIYLSAARSWLFNIVVAKHVELGHVPVTGDETGPLWGRGRSNASRDAIVLEDLVLGGWQDWCYALEHAGLKQERRKLWLKPENLIATWLEKDQLALQFALPSGCFATALLREIAELFRPPFEAL
jgi:tRNA pseudouridine13 synthase